MAYLKKQNMHLIKILNFIKFQNEHLDELVGIENIVILSLSFLLQSSIYSIQDSA